MIRGLPSKMARFSFAPAARSAFTALIVLLMASCNAKTPLMPVTGPEAEAGAEKVPSFGQFSDVPIPTQSEMDLERTIIFDARGAWIGRLVFFTAHDVTTVFDFYRNELPKFGWEKIAVVRSENSFLTYRNATRIATIKVQAATLRGTKVDMVISPEHGTQEGPSPPQ